MILTRSETTINAFIGRFQPLHNAHLQIIREGLKTADHLIINVGSAKTPRSVYNPFTFTERRHMIEACLTESELKRTIITGIGDHVYDDNGWVEDVQREVTRITGALPDANQTINLIGHSKDASGYYLKMFPTWGSINFPNYAGLSATPMRDLFFSKYGKTWLDNAAKEIIPSPVIDFFKNFQTSPIYDEMLQEFNFIRDYPKQWGKGPFLTTDAVVIQGAYILMIRRKGRPGKGQLAFPGGFLDIAKNETLQQGMLRELSEETNLDVPTDDLKASIVHSETFDAPFRDPRARIITHAFLLNLPKQRELPKIMAGDDAAHAEWMPFADLKEEDCFSDHFHIFQRLRGLIPKEV